MSQTIPKARKTAGSRRAVFIPGGVADLDAITVAEMTSGENISCYLTVFNKTADRQMIQDRRWCSSDVFQIPGERTTSLELTYVTNLNEPTDDEARIALAPGTEGTIVRVFQKDEDDDTFAEDDWYDAVDVLTDSQEFIEGDENQVDRLVQQMAIRSKWTDLKQLVTGA